MKRIYLLLILSLCAGISSAEVVSAITFNPSRLGTYTYLRAANSAVLAGGLETETMNVSSAGTVSVTTPSSDNIYVATEVRSEENASSTVTVNMPHTTFYGNDEPVGDELLKLSSITTVAIAGGTQTYTGGTQPYQEKSYVYLLDAASSLIQQVNTLKGGALTISGNAKDGRNLYYGTQSNGFYLAGNDIPEPGAAYTSAAKDLTGCEWAWVDRQGAKVLALDGCAVSNSGESSSTTSVKECTWVNMDAALSDNAYIYPNATLVDSNPTGTDCDPSQEGKIVFTKVGNIDSSGHYTIFGPIECTCFS